MILLNVIRYRNSFKLKRIILVKNEYPIQTKNQGDCENNSPTQRLFV